MLSCIGQQVGLIYYKVPNILGTRHLLYCYDYKTNTSENIGKPPKVYYLIANNKNIPNPVSINKSVMVLINNRIENAKHTIMVDDFELYTNILIIDDAVGSGATLNETAKQIKDKHVVKGNIIGLAITGSFKGFDIISEV